MHANFRPAACDLAKRFGQRRDRLKFGERAGFVIVFVRGHRKVQFVEHIREHAAGMKLHVPRSGAGRAATRAMRLNVPGVEVGFVELGLPG